MDGMLLLTGILTTLVIQLFNTSTEHVMNKMEVTQVTVKFTIHRSGKVSIHFTFFQFY